MRKGEKQQPEYFKGKPCKTCGTTTKISVFRIKPRQRNNIIYYKVVDIERKFGEVEKIKTYRCWECSKKESIRNNPNNDALSWQNKNREHLREYQRNYYKLKYRERNAINARRLRIATLNTPENKQKIKEFYNNTPKGMTVDHIYPIKGKTCSGLHVWWNLQYMTRSENSSKSNKILDKYILKEYTINNE